MMMAGQPLLAAYTRLQVGPRAEQHAWCAPCSPTATAYEIVTFDDEARRPPGLAELAPAW